MTYETDVYAIASCPELMALSEAQKESLKAVIHQTCCSTARKNDDNTKVILKWGAESENPLISLGITHTTYTHSEILDELTKEEWGLNEI